MLYHRSRPEVTPIGADEASPDGTGLEQSSSEGRGLVMRNGVSAIAAVLISLGLVALVVDDLRMHRALPNESTFVRQYMEGMVRNDPARMWQSYSADAQEARGGDREAYIRYMVTGTHAQHGRPNRYRLVAAVPLDRGDQLLFYQVDTSAGAPAGHIIVPLLVDATGRVDNAGDDGLTFRTPVPAPPPVN